MSGYGSLARYYDDFTQDVPYSGFADYFERLFRENGGDFRLLLDLCCGTGTLSLLLAERGYDMISADASPEMLMEAREKCAQLPCPPPLFINQSAAELDLFGTVDAAVSSLDSFNYIPPHELPEVFRRLHLFVRPGGLLIFDIRTPEFLRSMDGAVSVDENENALCLWRGVFEKNRNALVYGMDIFSREGEHWLRYGEEHVEYAHEPEGLCALLKEAGFSPAVRRDGPQGGIDRAFIVAVRDM